MDSTQWPKVTKEKPCPVCRKADWCRLSGDGEVALCARIEQGSFQKAKGNGGWLHRLKDSPDYHGGNSQHRPAPKSTPKTPKIHASIEAAIAAAKWQVQTAEKQTATLAGEWLYSVGGVEVMRVVRFNLADGEKQFRPIYPAAGGWRIGDPPGPLPLYRSDELPAPGTVWVLEGERCADAGAGLGLAATTSAHGSASAAKTDWTPLAEKQVCILPDADAAGEKYAADVSRILIGLTPPARVKVLRLPGLAANSGEDLVQWLEREGRDGRETEAIRAEIEALAAALPYEEPEPTSNVAGRLIMVCAADVIEKTIDWTWPPRIPSGAITLFTGRPKEGKSLTANDIAARISTGTPFPDGAPCRQGSVILVAPEDDIERVAVPRLRVAGADLRKVHFVTYLRRVDAEGKPYDVQFSLQHMAALEVEAKRHPDLRMIVIDPIGDVLGGGVDSHRDNEVRAILAPLANLAERLGVAVLVIAHRRKANGAFADDLTLGSRAFSGLARANWHISKDPLNKARRLFLPGGCNYAGEVTGLAFTIIGDNGEPPKLSWERDAVLLDADDGLAAENSEDGRGRPADEREAAEAWLAELLKDGEVLAATIKAEAKDAGFAWRTVHRAADALGVIREKNGFTVGWQWRFPKMGNTPKVPMKTPDTVNMASSFVRDPYVLTTTILSPKVPRAINKESGKYVASSADEGRIRQKLYGLARELNWPAAMLAGKSEPFTEANWLTLSNDAPLADVEREVDRLEGLAKADNEKQTPADDDGEELAEWRERVLAGEGGEA
ncbi:MAG: AAA family ATPase [Planctomycetota bacterium]|nr:AAA family ATPase [Planctomycetota bacterium]